MVRDLSSVVKAVPDGHDSDVESIWCSQCYLKTDRTELDFPHIREEIKIRGIGVPDLLVLSPVPGEGGEKIGADLPRVVMAVGDIKRSRVPGYHHKWQVAFYALLLETILSCHHNPCPGIPPGIHSYPVHTIHPGQCPGIGAISIPYI